MEEKESQARALLDKTNRQFNECNALYHAAAQRCGLSDAAFWTLYALVTSCEPLTQNRIAADWALPWRPWSKKACWRFAREKEPTAERS